MKTMTTAGGTKNVGGGFSTFLLSACIALSTVLLMFLGCGPSAESAKMETAAPAVMTKEMLLQSGQQWYLRQNLDSALSYVHRSLAMDASYRDALNVAAPLCYDLAMRADGQKKRNELLRKSREYYVKVETFGVKESDTYERICEIANMLNDDKTFVKYAKKNADAYPYERQYYNLSVAYANVEDWSSMIDAMKKAVEKFSGSQYIGSFYRQLGRAYTKIGRDQTAEKVFYNGLSAIDARIAEARKSSAEYTSSPEYARLKDDKIGMLVSLKNLHTTYKATAKLEEVERTLKEMGR